MSQKSYNNTPSLYLIPTPIGNMDDMTFRAINILKEVDFVLSEDTRVTSLLLSHFNIKKKLYANHKFNEEKNRELVKKSLEEGKTIGLVSDRGTPVISDPGYEIARYVISLGYNVIALPGATALIPALISSGISPMPFTYIGFLNNKESKRKKELEQLKSIKNTIILYEAPHRIESTLENILEVIGDRNISIAREITKKYEEIYRGKVSEVIKECENMKGEIVIVLEGNNEIETFDDVSIVDQINMYVEDGMTTMEAIKKVSKLRNIPKGEIYNMYHK